MVFRVKVGEVTLSANSSGSLSIEVDAGKSFTINELTFNSTGDFKITDIRDTATGEHYLSGTIYSAMLKDVNANRKKIDPQITLRGPAKLVCDVTDTSGSSNTVTIAFFGDEA